MITCTHVPVNGLVPDIWSFINVGNNNNICVSLFRCNAKLGNFFMKLVNTMTLLTIKYLHFLGISGQSQ